MALVRILRFIDNSLQANFDDKTILLLQPSATDVTIIEPNGSTSNYKCRFILSNHRAKLLQVMEFRNLHVEPPYICKELLQEKDKALLFNVLYILEYDRLTYCSLLQ